MRIWVVQATTNTGRQFQVSFLGEWEEWALGSPDKYLQKGESISSVIILHIIERAPNAIGLSN